MIFRKEKIEGKFIKIAQEHEVVMQYIDKLKNISKQPAEKKMAQLHELWPAFQSDMKHHYKIEERFLFPAALLTMPSIELIDMMLTLQKEHGYSERDMARMKALLDSQTVDTASVSQLLGTMIQDLEEHARIEMEQLFPQMDKNKKCRELIRGILLES